MKQILHVWKNQVCPQCFALDRCAEMRRQFGNNVPALFQRVRLGRKLSDRFRNNQVGLRFEIIRIVGR
jgi:hypothetical protein